jgi:DNA-binding transcriptional LysR family regulator
MDELIGHTPLLKPERLAPGAKLLLKLEYLNPAGSVKDRAALAMIEKELGVGLMNELTTVGRKNTAVILPLDPPESVEMGIAVPSLKKASPAARRFIEYMIRELKKED